MKLSIGTKIKSDKVELTITGIEVRELVGEWETWVMLDHTKLATNETRPMETSLRNLLDDIKRQGILTIY